MFEPPSNTRLRSRQHDGRVAVTRVTWPRKVPCTKKHKSPKLREQKPPVDIHSTHSSFTSVTLLGQVRDASNEQAWKEFVRRYTPKIFSWCKQNSLQDQDAADVTQEVLMKLVSAMRSFEYEPAKGSFRGWLKTVTTNAVRDLVRKRSGLPLTGGSNQQAFESLAEVDSIEKLADQIEAGYQEEILAEAESRVQIRVKPLTWQAYRLSADGKSATDIAKELNIKVADVYVSKSRVIKLLRETVAQLYR